MAESKENQMTNNSEDEISEYDLNDEFTSHPIKPKNSSLSQITGEGFEFEISKENNEREMDELNTKEQYWTREEILAHLESNPTPDDNICEDSGNYDERIKHMEDIYQNGVFKRVIRKGCGDLIKEESAVLYNLNAYLEGCDEPFDSTWLRGKPNLHKLSYDTILPGIYFGLLTMRRGERSEFIVRPEFAYLEMGCPPRVPPNSTILYIIEIIKLFEEGSLSHFETLSFDERQNIEFNHIYSLCDSERISGNSYYISERFRESAFRYRRAIRCLEQMTYKTKEEEDRAKQLLLKLYCNIANTYNKIQKPFNAMSNCKRALLIDANNYKALYQYGLAKMMNADYKEAKNYLTRVYQMKPTNSKVNEALHRLDQRMNGERIAEEELYKRMGSALSSNKK